MINLKISQNNVSIMKFLLIEPNQKNAELIGRLCRGMFFEVDVFKSFDTGLTRLENRSLDYDLVLIGAGAVASATQGWCQEVRQGGITIPIMVLTRSDDLFTFVQLLGTYADDCIRLPVHSAELVARIMAVLRRPREIVSDSIVLGPFSIDLLLRQVHHHEDPVMLSKKEFLILEYLVRRLDRVVDRNELLGHVWELPEAVMQNTLNAHIKNIRRKLSLPNYCDIETVRGIGYRMHTR